MKRTLILISLTMLMSMVVGKAFALSQGDQQQVGQLWYEVVSTSGNGANLNANVKVIRKDSYSSLSGDIDIPAHPWQPSKKGNTYVIAIDESAFSGCSNISSIIIPETVTSIGASAFSGCSSLTSITIPNTVTSFATSVFSGCSGLTSITITSSVTSIKASAFSGCTSLTSIAIPSSVTSIASSAFSGCSGLTTMTVDAANTKYSSPSNSNCIVETSSKTLICLVLK